MARTSSLFGTQSSAVHLLLIEAAGLGDELAVAQILDEKLISVEDASRPDTRLHSTSFGLTALHRAKTAEIARLLLDFGVPINCRGPLGQTPLHTCCDNAPVLRLLLERGADITAKTNDGSTALEWAVFADRVESVKLLLEKGANVQTKNKNGNTPLHLVSSKKMTELLLSFGAKVSVENNEGKIPLETAAERKGEPDFAAITELLLDVSEDRGLRFRSTNKTTSAQSLQPATDSFGGEQVDEKSKVRKRWSLVREKFLTQAGSVRRGRSGSIKEWHGEESAGSFYGGELDSTMTVGGDSGRRSDFTAMDVGTESNGDANEQNNPDEPSRFYTNFFEAAIIERPFLVSFIKVLRRRGMLELTSTSRNRRKRC